jgi:hypothetical protein
MVGKKGHIDYSGNTEDSRVSRYWELYRLGKMDKEIEDATGSTHMMVYNWRKHFGLKKNERMQPVTSNHVSKNDLNYIAGFLDGEGCVSIRKLNMKRKDGSPRFIFAPIIEISNTNREVLEYIRKALGLTINVNIHESGAYGNRKMAYKFAIKGWRNCLHVAKMLIPFSMVKQKQLYILIKFCEGRTEKFFMNTPYEEKDFEYYNTIVKLNSHGRDNDIPQIDIEGRFLIERNVVTEGNPKLGNTPYPVNEFDAHYIAGFFDAEGHIHIKLINSFIRKEMGFTNTDRNVIEWIRGKIGEHKKIYVVKGGTNCKEAYRLVFNGNEKCLSLCKTIYPYCIVRKERIGILMELIESRLIKSSHITNEERDLIEKMKLLNHRGL